MSKPRRTVTKSSNQGSNRGLLSKWVRLSIEQKTAFVGVIIAILGLFATFIGLFKNNNDPEFPKLGNGHEIIVPGDGNTVTVVASQPALITQLNARIGDLVALRNSLTRELESQDALARARIDTFNRQIRDLEAQLADPDQTYREYVERITALETLVSELSGDVSNDEIDTAFAAIARFNYEPADDLLQRVYERERNTGALERMARAAFGRGLIAEEEVRWLEAAEHYAEAARLEPTIDHHTKAGSFLSRAGQYNRALRHMEDALDLARAEGTSSEVKATTMNNLAALLQLTGRYADAEPLYRKALEIGRETLGERHPKVAIRLNNLAGLLQLTGRYADAEELYREALEIVRDRHPFVATYLSNLAGLLETKAQYADAEPLYRMALEIYRETLDDRHPEVALGLNNLAGLLRATGRYADAEQLHREALEMGRETLGNRHPDMATILNGLALLMQATEQYAEAEPLHREALAIGRETQGDRHPFVATRLNDLALLLQSTGRYAEAELLHREALAIGRETLDDRHPDMATILNDLALLLQATGRYAKAEPLYREALEIGRETLGDRHPEVANRLSNLALLLEDTERADQATPLFQEAVAILRAALGDDHPNTQRVAQNSLRNLRAHTPDHPDLADLVAVFGSND